MRLWSINPKYLDSKGLVAVWREGLLAQTAVLNNSLGKKSGYQNHSQLTRFYNAQSGNYVSAVCDYLWGIWIESKNRRMNFNKEKIIEKQADIKRLSVTAGQLAFEFCLLMDKYSKRKRLTADDEIRYKKIVDTNINCIDTHPIFYAIAGPKELWEKM